MSTQKIEIEPKGFFTWVKWCLGLTLALIQLILTGRTEIEVSHFYSVNVEGMHR